MQWNADDADEYDERRLFIKILFNHNYQRHQRSILLAQMRVNGELNA
jgi:hypothetical protein